MTWKKIRGAVFFWSAVLILASALTMLCMRCMLPPPVDDVKVRQWQEQMERNQADPGWLEKQKKINLKHGGDIVAIYEPGKTPYYYDKKGRKHKFQ